MPGDDAPLIRGGTLIGFIEAARRLEGGSLDIVRALQPDLARTLFDELVLATSWFPESHLVELCDAVFRGPMREAPGPYADYLDRSVDLGWGRIQRALVGFATPKMLAERAAKLWRKEHTHGELIAELLRHIVSLTRVGVVRQTHAPEPPRSVRIELEW